MRSLEQELAQLREDREREQELSARRAHEDEEELQILRDRCERLEAGGGGGAVRTFSFHLGLTIPEAQLSSYSRLDRAMVKFLINCDRTWRDS